MEPQHIDRKKIIIVILIILILLLLLTAFLLTRFNRNNNDMNNNTTAPILDGPTPEVTGDFTGYVDPSFSQAELNEIDQNAQLRELSPYTGNGFTITYNYETFKFDVVIVNSFPDARNNFDTFVNSQYPSIPQEKFNIMDL